MHGHLVYVRCLAGVNAGSAQCATAIDGSIVDLCGPVAGCHSDKYLLGESNLLAKLMAHMNGPAGESYGEAYCLFGDPA